MINVDVKNCIYSFMTRLMAFTKYMKLLFYYNNFNISIIDKQLDNN